MAPEGGGGGADDDRREQAKEQEAARGNSPCTGNIAAGSCSDIAADTASPQQKRSGFRWIPVAEVMAEAAAKVATEGGRGGSRSVAFRGHHRCFQYSPFPSTEEERPWALQTLERKQRNPQISEKDEIEI